MKWLNDYKMKLMLVVIVAALVLGGGIANADFTFGTPMLFDEPVNSTGIEYFGCISADGLEVYIDKPVSGGITSLNWDIYMSTRETINDPWSVPASVGPTIHRGYVGGYESLSSDGLELYFSSRRPGGYGMQDIWVTRRAYRGAAWGAPENIGPPINTSDSDWIPWITPDGLELYFSSDRPGGYGMHDIWVAIRSTTNDEWQEPVNLGPVVNTVISDCYPCLSPDGLVLFFSDYDNSSCGFRPGGHGYSDMWMTRRKSIADPWEEPVNLGPGMNSSSFDSQPRLSPDGSVLFFTSSRPDSSVVPGNTDIWQVPIIPIVDFNADGIVDAADMCIMIDHWGENYSLCDIGPMPWGDGVVDVEDLKVLAEHLFEEVKDPSLVAHWTLDETDGEIAYDSAGVNDAFLLGGPIWQPAEGKINGALQFDGIDDYANAGFVLNPSSGPFGAFSAYAWIKGGTPGQVIISQTDGAGFGGTWLGADQADGKLFTNLMYFELASESVITDGQWHHVGIVWDGSRRCLYVDEEEVARDTSDMTAIQSTGDLYLGAGKNLEATSFFSGLIDDIRIYNRAVHP